MTNSCRKELSPNTVEDEFETLACVLDERTRRLVAAAEASAIGHGGVTLVAAASGLSRGERLDAHVS